MATLNGQLPRLVYSSIPLVATEHPLLTNGAARLAAFLMARTRPGNWRVQCSLNTCARHLNVKASSTISKWKRELLAVFDLGAYANDFKSFKYDMTNFAYGVVRPDAAIRVESERQHERAKRKRQASKGKDTGLAAESREDRASDAPAALPQQVGACSHVSRGDEP
jgi:hypothetical protein